MKWNLYEISLFRTCTFFFQTINKQTKKGIVHNNIQKNNNVHSNYNETSWRYWTENMLIELDNYYLHTTTNCERNRKTFQLFVGWFPYWCQTLIITIWAHQWQKQVLLVAVHWCSSNAPFSYLFRGCALAEYWTNFKNHCLH